MEPFSLMGGIGDFSFNPYVFPDLNLESPFSTPSFIKARSSSSKKSVPPLAPIVLFNSLISSNEIGSE